MVDIKMKNKKGAIISDYLGWIVLGFFALIIILGIYLVMTGKLGGMLEFIKNLFRFGR